DGLRLLARRLEDVCVRLIHADDAHGTRADPNPLVERRNRAEQPLRHVRVEDYDGRAAQLLRLREPTSVDQLAAVDLRVARSRTERGAEVRAHAIVFDAVLSDAPDRSVPDHR